VIAYAGGSIYARKEFLALLDALDVLGWTVSGRRVRVRLLASAFQIERRRAANIEFLGYRTEAEAMPLLAEADVGYLPYWFDPYFSLSVRYCFPSKLSSYLAAGLPVLFHGPSDSSVARFFKDYPVGLCCHEPGPDAVAGVIRAFAGKAAGEEFIRERRRALEEQFDMDVFVRRSAELLGVEPSIMGLM
jgi:glycosyltransferase involved in cell wall biosynthesis